MPDQHGFRDELRAIGAPPAGVAAERILDALSDAGFSRALEVLIDGLAAGGAILGEWDGRREPRILATAGTFTAISDRADIFHFFAGIARYRDEQPRCIGTILDDQYACAALARRGRELLTLVVHLDALASHDLSLLRFFLRLADPLRAPRRTTTHIEPQAFADDYVIGPSRAMQELHRELQAAARAEFPLLLSGESGTGRTTLARMAHAWSRRRGGPLVFVQCTAMPEQLPHADGGTIVFEDPGALPMYAQSRLLYALRDCEARLITIATPELEEQMRTGRFRSDLYYRLGGAILRVPSLRERREDVPRLVQHLVKKAATETRQPVRGITVRAVELLSQAQWPGNIPELERELRTLVCRCAPGEAIDTNLLSESILLAPTTASPRSGFDLATRVDEVERHTIRQALLRARGNRSVAARLLGLSRNGLALKMRRLAL